MNIGILLIFLVTTRTSEKSFQSHTSDLNDDDILEALSDLILSPDSTKQNRQLDNFEFVENIKSERQTFSSSEKCDLVGFEFKKGVECKEVVEVECGPTNVTKTRYELVNKCKSSIETKCGVTNVEVPQQHCRESLRNR